MADALFANLDSGGSGGATAPATPAPTTGAPSPTSTSAPATAQDLSDDTLVRIPGQTEPVKYGDLYKRLQADHTRKTTAAAQARQKYEQERQTWERQKQQEETYLKSLAAQLIAQRGNGNTQPSGFVDELSQLQYLDGKAAAKLMQHIQTEGFGPVVSAIQERDKVIQQLYQQVLDLSKQFKGFSQQSQGQQFEGKIRNFVKATGLPDSATDYAKRLYLAYEGDDLDQEFPDILRDAWNRDANLLRQADKQRVQAARAPGVPGKGGSGTPGGKAGLTGRENAKDTTNFLWDYIQAANASDKT